MHRAFWTGLAVAGAGTLAARRLRAPLQKLVREAPGARFDPLDPDALEKAVRFSRLQERLWLVSTVWGFALDGFSLATGTPRTLAVVIRAVVRPRLQTPAFVLAWSLQEWLLDLPLSYYIGYVVEQRFGLTNQSRRGWLVDHLKVFGVGAAINTPLTTSFLFIARRYPQRWWIIASAIAVPITVLFAGLYPVLIAPIFNKYETLEDDDLANRVRRMSETEGVRVSRVMRMDMSRQTSKANAFFAGVGRSKRIVLADTLIDQFTPAEVETVVAHELAHQVHRDTWKLIGLSGVATVAGAWLLHKVVPNIVRRTRPFTGASTLGDPASLPLVGLVTSVFGLLAMPLMNASVRRMERNADRYAVRLTQDPQAFIGAMRRLQQTNLADPDPPTWVRVLLHSHPSIGERVRWAEEQVA
ncbi:MAG: M48 family metallopeptidase [Chloroflexota bacterium]|nr:M48 family metallopeptidase [Chloroflexota bacterium]